ncbi:MAG: cytochrome c3 family protein [Candidatus Krumholzibacteriota bacterium]
MRILHKPEPAATRLLWALAFALGLGLALGGSPARAVEDYVPHANSGTVCSLCHTCEFPTGEDLCLSKDFCMRSKGAHGKGGLPGQEIMVMDELEKVYDPVYFNHEKHAQMGEMSNGCVECHHFMPPSAGHPACKECHESGNLHSKIEPGLKAAYHRQCMACHTEWDTETHCEFCHRKKVGGMTDAQMAKMPFMDHKPPLAVKDLIVFETDYDDGDKVPFHHANHVNLYDRDCSVCHENETCASCHVHGTESHPLGLISDVDLHDTCYKCHDEDKGCEQCHGRNRNDLFDHTEVGWELQPYHKVLQCNDCHHTRGKYTANDPRCHTCHFDGWDEEHFNHGVTGVVLDEVHLEIDCTDCHVRGLGKPSTCDECHDDGRRWVRHGSFGPGIE